MKMLRKFKKIIFIFLAILVISLAVVSAFIETDIGSRWIVNQVARWAHIDIGTVSGNLRKGLDIEFIDYQWVDQYEKIHHYRAEKVSFRWRPIDLVYAALVMQKVHVEQLFISLPEKTEKKSTELFKEWPSLGLPLRINLQQVHIEKINYQQGKSPLSWQDLKGSVSLGSFHLRYHKLSLSHADYQLVFSGKTDLHFPYETQATLSWLWRQKIKTEDVTEKQELVYLGNSELSGNLNKLSLATKLHTPVILNVKAITSLVNDKKEWLGLPQITLNAHWEDQIFPPHWWAPKKIPPITTGSLIATGNWLNYKANITGDISIQQLPDFSVDADIQGDYKHIAIKKLIASDLNNNDLAKETLLQKTNINLVGNVIWLPELELQANLEVMGEIQGVNLEAKGDIYYKDQQLQTNAINLVVGANQLDLQGSINLKELAGESLALKNDIPFAQAAQLTWNLRAPLLNQLHTDIQCSLNSKGNLNTSINMELTVDQCRWRDTAVEKITFHLQPEKQKEEYSLALSVKKLKIADEKFSSINLDGNGNLKNHDIKVTAKNLNYGRINSVIQGGYSDNQWQGHFDELTVKLKNVPRWWLTSSETIKIKKDSLFLDKQCLTTATNTTAVIEQKFIQDERTIEKNEKNWIKYFSPVKNPYHLLENNSVPQQSLITKYASPQLCINGSWSNKEGVHLRAALDSVPLRQFLYLFKPEVYFAGVMDGVFRFNAKTMSLADVKATAKIDARNPELRYQYAGGATEIYAWKNLAMNAQLDKGKLFFDAGLDWIGYGNMSLAGQLNLLDKKIDKSRLQANFTNLAPLETFLTFANDVKGHLNADLSFGGSFSQPFVLGNIKLREASANMPRLGIDLQQIELNAQSTQAGSLGFSGQVRSGKGTLSATGNLTGFGGAQWTLDGSIEGDQFELINLPELKARINPTMKIAANKNLLNFSGDAHIPLAKINIKTLPATATLVSNDVVVLDEKFTQDTSASGYKVATNINLSLGDQVEFQGFGLNSQLAGKLNLYKEVNTQYFTSGYVSVTEGTYKAYGQKLTIDRGRLIFQGTYENPGLDIRASRYIKGAENSSTQVGLEIDGTLQKPSARVFSVPARSDSDAMMMLLTGKELNAESKNDASLLIGAVGGLGAGSGESIGGQVANFFRVDELEMRSSKGIDQSQLWVGKYVTPRLLVRYIVGLFDNAFSLGMEYQLSNRFRLEAESGETQSVDVVYKIER
jgi:translocation and assembly module TamB